MSDGPGMQVLMLSSVVFSGLAKCICKVIVQLFRLPGIHSAEQTWPAGDQDATKKKICLPSLR